MFQVFKNKFFLFVILTLILLVIIGVSARETSTVNNASSVVGTVLSPFQKAFSFIGSKFSNAFSFFAETKAIRDENKSLKAQIDKLENDNRKLKGFEDENKRLREVLKLKDVFSDYEFLGCNVIASDAGIWDSVLEIDRGSKDGIIIDKNSPKYYPVITGKGLVGRVINTSVFSSKIVTLLDNDSTVMGRIVRTRDPVRIRGDLRLKEKGLCKMDYIPADADIAVGDLVETSGEGKVFPKGILIGKIKQINQSNSDINRYAIIEPAVDFKRLEEAVVLVNKSYRTK